MHAFLFEQMGELNIGAKTGDNYSNVKCIILAYMLESARQ